jgi:hypothetical protein
MEDWKNRESVRREGGLVIYVIRLILSMQHDARGLED